MMMGTVASLIFVLWLTWVYYRDAKERVVVSPAVWFVVAWVAMYGSRPVTEWFSVGGDISRQVALDEGNPLEASVSLSLIVAGLVVLFRRRIQLSSVIACNVWLCIFYLFWLLSIVWSDYPVVTLKRVFKDLGNVVMVLVVLSDRDPIAAMRAVMTRVAYLCIPMSVLLIRYYPDLGRTYSGFDRSELMWVGVATHKNTLGVLAFVGALFLLWVLLDAGNAKGRIKDKPLMVSRCGVLLLCWYLLLIANSATSLLCAVVGSALLITLGLPSITRMFGRVEALMLTSAILFVVIDSFTNIKELIVVDLLGRDMTLTTRTEVWPILLNYQDSPLVGAGFNSFWAGERLTQLFNTVGGIIQAHNGYLETYLNGGLVGVGLLLVLLSSTYFRIRKKLVNNQPGSSMRFIMLVLAIMYNNSEASFNKVGIMWFVTLYALMEYRTQLRPHATPIRKHVSRPVLVERTA
ncbi:MAG: O-antigen ligase family protein [Nitrospira sp.]|nr:O-antigen ligase family protein [Nitrospira sp.]